ncbi:MAG: alpha/beta hydrolase [Pseudomonadales bacterium]|nr:alpha/beta hydrolase [Pseudomonadales bacterium]
MFVFLSVISVLLTAAVYIRIKRIGWLMLPWFFIAWLGAELAWFHLIWESIAIALKLGFGSLESSADKIALAAMLVCMALQWKIHRDGQAAGSIYAALFSQLDIGDALSPDRPFQLLDASQSRDWLHPFRMRRPGVEKISDVVYGDHARNRLDIYRARNAANSPSPVLLQVHGGGWVIGDKKEQALPLMHQLAQNGWVCVAINYRLGPQNRMPAHIEDVKKALAWIKQHIAEYGGDPEFIAITGGSAGGHLSSLAALTPHIKAWQPGFEEIDLAVQACVPFYGIFDFTDRHNTRGKVSMEKFLGQQVMPAPKAEAYDLWEQLSPLSHVGPHAPPMLVIHGTHDSLAFVEEARIFVEALRTNASNPVVYAELPNTQHAFDIFHSPRSTHTVAAIQRFLEYCYANYLAAVQQEVQLKASTR